MQNQLFHAEPCNAAPGRHDMYQFTRVGRLCAQFSPTKRARPIDWRRRQRQPPPWRLFDTGYVMPPRPPIHNHRPRCVAVSSMTIRLDNCNRRGCSTRPFTRCNPRRVQRCRIIYSNLISRCYPRYPTSVRVYRCGVFVVFRTLIIGLP